MVGHLLCAEVGNIGHDDAALDGTVHADPVGAVADAGDQNAVFPDYLRRASVALQRPRTWPGHREHVG